MKLCYEINEETAKKVNVESYNEKLNNSIAKMITIVPNKSMYSGIRLHIKSDTSDKSYIFIRLNDFELNILANSEKISTDMTLIVKRQIDGLTTDYFKLDANSDSTFLITISENDDILDVFAVEVPIDMIPVKCVDARRDVRLNVVAGKIYLAKDSFDEYYVIYDTSMEYVGQYNAKRFVPLV